MRVLTVGLHIADVLGRYVSEIPAGQGLALLDEIRLTVAGTAAATAVNLAKLGVDVETIGVVGDDALGTYLRSTMQSYGIGCDRLRTSNSSPTSATMLPIRPDGSRPALHVIGANGDLNELDVPDEALAGFSFLHMGGTCLLPGFDGEPTARLLSRAKALGLTTTLDYIPTGSPADQQALMPALQWVDYLLPSEEDALSFAGASTRLEAIDFYLNAGVKTVVITMGGEGVSVSTRDSKDVRLPAYEIDLVDTTGCGDAFSSGFIAGLASKNTVLDSVELGLACGSLVATGLGSDAGIVDLESVTTFQAQQPRLSL